MTVFTLCAGIAVADIDEISDTELWSMNELGVRGLTINMQAEERSTDVDALRKVVTRTAERIKMLPGWRIQLFCAASIWDDLYDTISNLPVGVLADHIGGLHGSSKLRFHPEETSDIIDVIKQPGFDALVKLAKDLKVVIKVSGNYRLSNPSESGYDDLESLIKTLAETIPDQLVWGNDWPHTGEGKDRLKRGKYAIEEFRRVNDERILQKIRNWIGNEDTWEKMMTINPEKICW